MIDMKLFDERLEVASAARAECMAQEAADAVRLKALMAEAA